MASHLARFVARTLPHLAVFAIVLLAFGSRTGAFWQCEGRVCGVTAWACCCAVPTSNHDPNCGPSLTQAQTHFQSTAHLQETSVCVADCHCTMTVQSADQFAPRTASFEAPTPFLFVVVLPPVVALEAPRVVAVPRSLESRGPLRSSTLLAHPSLRGPPLA